MYSRKLILLVSHLMVFAVLLQAQVSHSLFIAGHDFTGILGEEGEVIWDSERPHARDGYVLENGNVLICWKDEVVEYDRDHKVLFSYKKSSEEVELGTAVRLDNGNTLITESGNAPRIIEVDMKGKIVQRTTLEPETDNIHMQTRMARKLENGNYLVPHLLAFKVKEYQADGTIVKTFTTDREELGGREGRNWPFTAIRLENGNTLVTLTNGNKVVELDPEGQIVWKVTNEDFEGKPLADPCGAQRLPNGNTVIASYGAKEGIRLLEIDREKNIVWTHSAHNAHHFQILTTNGEKIEGKPLK
jgi:hypothetical protein